MPALVKLETADKVDYMKKHIRVLGCVFTMAFVLMNTAHAAMAEKVCLKDATKEQKELISEYDNKYYGGHKDMIETIEAAVVDINNDKRLEIVYSDVGRMGSGGYSWSMLLNLGDGKYKQMDIFYFIGNCLVFLPEMKNGFRVAEFGRITLIYDPQQHLYVKVGKKIKRSGTQEEPLYAKTSN